MDESKISVRYAKALLNIAIERDIIDMCKDDMNLIEIICKQNPEFISFLENPIILSSDKWKLIQQVLKSKIHDISLNFIELILNNNRESFLESISRNFLDLYRVHKGIKNAWISSAVELDKNAKDKIVKALEIAYKSDIVIEESVNKDLIGGFILRLGDKQFDASISTQLKKIKKELMGSDYSKAI